MRHTTLALLAGLSACSSSSSPSAPAGDAGLDAAMSGPDASIDAASDATPDSSVPGDAAGDGSGSGPVDAPSDVAVEVGPVVPEGGILHPCGLPGTIQFTSSGTVTLPGGSPSWPSLSFLHLPMGFCAHYFGTVGNARQLRFAPGGDALVASPTTPTTGGGAGGGSAIFLLPDANLDGVADSNVTYLGGLPSTQGLLFTGGYLYYQDGTAIQRVPYVPGDQSPSGAAVKVADLTGYVSSIHWPKTLDVADDGTLYVGNGGDQFEMCVTPHPFHGGILKIDPAPGPNPGGVQVAQGLRNPINVRCRHGDNTCFALELALDYSGSTGGREKLIPIRQGDDWGFPCCATTNLPYASSPTGTDCSTTATDTDSFLIGDTPFGVDFEPGFWTGQWAGQAFVVTHGAAGSWAGARIVAIPMNGATGLPVSASDTSGSEMGMVDFATGWEGTPPQNGRPAAVTFSPDGRLFVANDNNGVIFWVAALSQ